MYIDQYEATPWEAIRYLIGEANYGGRVTDAWDRVLLNTYLSTWYQDGIFETENFKMSSLPTYYIPDDGPLQSHKDYINQLPNFDMLPVINFKPTEAKKKAAKGIYNCPCYYYPIRTGTRERPSYMITVDLKSGKVEADHWIKRGTALLLSLAT